MDSLPICDGFLPSPDPKKSFSSDSPLAMLDELGRDLPSILEDKNARQYLMDLTIPMWPSDAVTDEELPGLRLYYVRLGFIASGYINQIGQAPATRLPKNIAIPLCHACRLLNRPPILSYDGYALYNWKRFDPNGPIALGNIDTLQNFVHLYDEHWFILIHVEIEALAADLIGEMRRAVGAIERNDAATLNACLDSMTACVYKQAKVLQRIPEKMDPHVYFRSFRPYIRFFENVVYEGVIAEPMSFRGETGAQSSIIPALVAFLKIPHQASMLTNHLADMKQFMPAPHRAFLQAVASMPDPKPLANPDSFNNLLEEIARFREIHFGWADLYIHQRVSDPRGTGGTPYRQWLQQLIDETRAHKKS